MDGTFTTTTTRKHRKVMRTGRFSALATLAGIAVVLHVALFAALDAVAPLGSDVVQDTRIEIQSDLRMRPASTDGNDFENVIADAR